MSPVEDRIMNKLLAVLMLFLPLTGVLAADNGDVTDVREIDRLRPDSTYKLIWEPHLAKWTDKHLVCCYGLQLQSKTDMGDIVCSISRDGGKTWSPRTMVLTTACGMGRCNTPTTIRCCFDLRARM
ncbi:MAG: hypothetical protein OSA98_05925 [Rubripirellula sp.]|nr:hypothetical protein [Rubripirellula sp.]